MEIKELKDVLEKMFEIAGHEFDFEQLFEECDWYHTRTWTNDKEQEFKDWFENHFKNNRKELKNIMQNPISRNNKELRTKILDEFLFMYGFRVVD